MRKASAAAGKLPARAQFAYVRQGNIRRAIRAVAAAKGIKVGKVEFKPYFFNENADAVIRQLLTGRPEPVHGAFQAGPPYDMKISTASFAHEPEAMGHYTVPLEVAAHELAHGTIGGKPQTLKEQLAEHTPAHEKAWRKMSRSLSAAANVFAMQDKATIANVLDRRVNRAKRLAAAAAARKSSSSGGGDVSVSAHERNGQPVHAYVRSRPGR